MATDTIDILVYADWQPMADAGSVYIGVFSAQQAKGRKSFSFEYDPNWLKKNKQITLDPDIGWFGGQQYPINKQNFGIFADSMPDTWGRTLMKRRAAIQAKEQKKTPAMLNETDFLLGVYDETRMGALRFKLDPNGPFLDDNRLMPTPPWARIRELQHAAEVYESDSENAEIKEWINILITPGSSLGGARPKANILDEFGNLWIAKFPSMLDEINKAAWEYLAYLLAQNCGIIMSESKLEKVAGKHNTFFTKRFDRQGKDRIHFASAMTMVGKNEEILRDSEASYLELVDVITTYGAQPEADLEQLWRRIVFHIAISNTDDHLRNHGFILTPKGWILSPAFDINPSIDKAGLALNVDDHNNALDFELAKSVGEYFRLSEKQMDQIITEVISSVSSWRNVAKDIGIPRSEQELMAGAFRV